MPFKHSISALEKRATVVASGRIELKLITGMIWDLIEDAKFDPAFSILVNLCEMKYEPRIEDLPVISKTLKAIKNKIRNKVALLVAPNMLFAVQSATLFADTAGFKMQVFTKTKDVEKWLALP